MSNCDNVKIEFLSFDEKKISVSKNNLEFVKEPLWSYKRQGQYIYIHVNWQFSILNFKFEYIGRRGK